MTYTTMGIIFQIVRMHVAARAFDINTSSMCITKYYNW